MKDECPLWQPPVSWYPTMPGEGGWTVSSGSTVHYILCRMSVHCDSLQYPGILPCHGREVDSIRNWNLGIDSCARLKNGALGVLLLTQPILDEFWSFYVFLFIQCTHFGLYCRSKGWVYFPQGNNLKFWWKKVKTQIDSAFWVSCLCIKSIKRP
jgi:hypothetical protein